MAALALVICVLQVILGRRIGRRYGDPVSGGQGLGQKNTILAIWIAQVLSLIHISIMMAKGPDFLL